MVQKIKAGHNYDLFFIGDSITDQFDARGRVVWDHYYGANNESRKPFNIGISGDRTEHVLWRMDNGSYPTTADKAPKVVVMMIGYNNTNKGQSSKDTAAGIKRIIERVHSVSADTKVLLLSIFSFRPKNLEVNHIIKGYHNGTNVIYLDISGAFRFEEDGRKVNKKYYFIDGVHPNSAGYKAWAEAIEPTLSKLLGDKPVSNEALDNINTNLRVTHEGNTLNVEMLREDNLELLEIWAPQNNVLFTEEEKSSIDISNLQAGTYYLRAYTTFKKKGVTKKRTPTVHPFTKK